MALKHLVKCVHCNLVSVAGGRKVATAKASVWSERWIIAMSVSVSLSFMRDHDPIS
jgi:hypothetical protein